MNYAEQQVRLARFQTAKSIVIALFMGVMNALLLLTYDRLDWYEYAVAFVISAGAAVVFSYVALYLGLTVERRKSYVWPVKVRVVAIPLLAVLVLPFLTTSARWYAWAACVAIAVIGVLSARRALKRLPDAPAVPLLPLVLLLGDLAILLIAAAQGRGAFSVCIAGVSLAVALFLVTAEDYNRWLGLAAAALALACVLVLAADWRTAGLAALVPIILAIGTWRLVSMARQHHESNVVATVEELTAFAETTPEYAEEMLSTATGILARNWNSDPPVDPEAVGRWYEANSEYYLYDLAQFHLAYKHIRFMIDIVEMSDGRVLDYGAGIGDLVLELARRGNDVTYLDVDGRTKAFARWRAARDWLPVEFVSDLDEVEGPFDTIVSLDVFEHLAEPLPVVDQLVERLAPGGRMIVTAYFGATKSHPMHFDHDIDLGAYLRASGLVDRKTFAMKYLRSQFLGKPGVLVFEKPDRSS